MIRFSKYLSSDIFVFFYFILVQNQSFLPQVFYCRIIIIKFLTGIRFSKAEPREKLIDNVPYVFVPYRLPGTF